MKNRKKKYILTSAKIRKILSKKHYFKFWILQIVFKDNAIQRIYDQKFQFKATKMKDSLKNLSGEAKRIY